MEDPLGFLNFCKMIPVWEAIEDYDFVIALKLITIILAEHPSCPFFTATKAQILSKMGRPDEALCLALIAKEAVFSNDALILNDRDFTLTTLRSVCDNLRTSLFATTTRQTVLNELDKSIEFMECFKVHVHKFQFEDQERMALKLYESTGEERFLHWTVLSIQLKAFFGGGSTLGNELLCQAEVLIKKHISAHGLHEAEGLLLYVSILEHGKNYKPALEVLSGELGKTLLADADRLRLVGRLLARKSDFSAAAVIFKEVLGLCPDDWECFLDYLGCLLDDDSRWSDDVAGCIFNQIPPLKFVDCKLNVLSAEEFNSRISNALAFVKDWQRKTALNVRCPFLASVEIERRKRLYGMREDAKFMEAFVNYYRRFGGLASFTSDVFRSLQVLTDEEQLVLLWKFHTSFTSPSILQVKCFEGWITIFKTEQWFGTMLKLPVGEVEEIILYKTNLYLDNLELLRESSPEQSSDNDELLCMLFWRTQNLGYFVEAVMVLEFGANIQRFFPQYKILLVHLYSCFNALPLAYEWYKSLELRGIRNETMAHHILPQMLFSSHWGDLGKLLQGLICCIGHSITKISDQYALAYSQRNYSKVIEIVQLKNKLQYSYHYLISRVEGHILQLKQAADAVELVKSILQRLDSGMQLRQLSSEESCKYLCFNDELELRPWWTPGPNTNYLTGPFDKNAIRHQQEHWWREKELVQAREANARIFISRRASIPRFLHLSLQFASFFMMKRLHPSLNTLVPDAIKWEFMEMLINLAKTLGVTFSHATYVIDNISAQTVIQDIQRLDSIQLMTFAVFLNAWKLGVMNSISSWTKTDSVIQKCMEAQVKRIQPLISSIGFSVTELVTSILEPLSWHLLVLQQCVYSLPLTTKVENKRRWDSEEPYISKLLIRTLSSSIESVCNTIQMSVQIVTKQNNGGTDDEVNKILSSIQRVDRTEGPGKVYHRLEVAVISKRRGCSKDRISRAMQSWDAAEVAKGIVKAHDTTLSEFFSKCKAKLQLLQKLRERISAIN